MGAQARQKAAQPTEERRRFGSHYTPRSLTVPVVRSALDPVLKQLGGNPTPEQVLNLKVCDPTMGSGAFLVEACRYLGDALVKAWAAHETTPDIPGAGPAFARTAHCRGGMPLRRGQNPLCC